MRTKHLILAAALTAALAAAAAQAAPAAAPYSPPLANQPMSAIVGGQLIPQLGYFAQKLRAEKDKTEIAGYPAFNGKDKFLPGKVASGLGHVLLDAQRDKRDLTQPLADFRNAADMMVAMDNHTWGIYYYLVTLYELKKAGLLEQAVAPATLEKLKLQLDWRHFVTKDFKLISLPTNYYGVAFGVARLRFLLGWEDEAGGQALLDKLLKHYEEHSGKYGWSDETDGEGRFDRYSILLISEICERLIDTGLTVSPELKARLRQAAEIALSLGNTSGDGFTFGRSIGTYGETALLEILSVAAYLDVLTPEEKEYAYAFSTTIVAKYADFWYDPAMHSVDMWTKGRRTDAYRGIHRILGENFSLLHQLIKTNVLWRKAGFDGKVPKQDLQAWLDKTQPKFRLTWFARGEYDRALAIYRAKGHEFSLLMVNGGAGQHANSPYAPLPFSNGIIAGVADSGPKHAQLLPKFTLADGTELVATSFIKDIRSEEKDGKATIRYRQDELAVAANNGKSPVKDARLKVETTYTLEDGLVTRTDVYTPAQPLEIKRALLEFAAFSEDAKQTGATTNFGAGFVTSYEVEGLPDCAARKLDNEEAFRAPLGAMKTLVTCSASNLTLKAPLTIRWRMRFR